MQNIYSLITLLAALAFIILAARQLGGIFAKFKLPLISGFLFAGILAGPFVLNFIKIEHIPQLILLDKIALAFIAFAAGAELEIHVIRNYFRSIISIISGLVISVFVIGIAAFILIKDLVPFMADLPMAQVVAIAMLGATIMIARSPSSALAIIKELRAKGPFTHKVLGATVMMDAVVILIFAVAVSIAAVLVEGSSFEISFIVLVILEIVLDICLGIFIGYLLDKIMRIPSRLVKNVLILLIGLAIFLVSDLLHGFHLFSLPVAFFSEPLLISMVAGFYVTNYSRYAAGFRHQLEEMSPAIFLLFFSLVGIELELDILSQIWVIVLVLFFVRVVAIFVGTIAATTLTGDKSPGNKLLGLGFITQAGVSIGLAKEIGVEFEHWGQDLATLLIGVIVVNQIVGPPLMKWVINHVGESHTKADAPDFDGTRDVVIFGVETQSLALSRQLKSNGWNVVLVTCHEEARTNLKEASPQIKVLPSLSPTALATLDLEHVEGVVLLLSDAENYAVCEYIYEHHGIENVVVRLEKGSNFDKFNALGALVVQEETAMVGLLDQFVRSPFSASLLLGMNPDEQFVELQIHNPDINDVALRDIHFPHDVLVLAITRDGHRLVSHGYTRLAVGDHVTVVGSPDSLEEIRVKFEA